MSWLQHLDSYDQTILLLLNSYHSPFWDSAMLFLTNKATWIGLYVLILLALIKYKGWQALYYVLLAALAVAIADQIASTILKPWVGRLRPCHNPALYAALHLVPGACGGKFGFVSSHAANSFALALTVGWMWGRRYNWVLWVMVAWAILQGYTRVYLAVHYPGDIIGGLIVGGIAAGLVLFIAKRLGLKPV